MARRLLKQPNTKPIEREYSRELLQIVAPIRQEYTSALPRIQGLLRRAADARMRIDAGETDELARILAELNATVLSKVEERKVKDTANKYARRTAAQSKEQLQRRIRAALGRDIFSAEPGFRSQFEAFINTNATLVKGLTDESQSRLARKTFAAIQNGTLGNEFADQLRSEFDFTENRAKLIARDQITKFYGQQNNLRAQAMGLKRYRWATSGDERVRPEHARLEGKIFEYDGPGAPGIGHPGQDIQCRCGDDPIFEDLGE